MNNRFQGRRFGEESFHGERSARPPDMPAGGEGPQGRARGAGGVLPRVVLLDGDPELRRRICQRLRGGGCLAFEAHDVAEAQVLLDAAQPDAVLVNLSLPVLGTGGFLTRFSEDERWAGVPLILFTPRMSGPLLIRRPAPAAKAVALPDGSAALAEILTAVRACLTA